jgi:hypothetical protein
MDTFELQRCLNFHCLPVRKSFKVIFRAFKYGKYFHCVIFQDFRHLAHLGKLKINIGDHVTSNLAKAVQGELVSWFLHFKYII